MKEINAVYRGKVVGSNTGFHHHDWMYGNLVEELSTGKVFICDLSHFDSDTKLVDVMVEVDPETVGQYTGLRDRNYKRIYEGDIVIVNRYDLLSTRWNDDIENEEKILIMIRVGYVFYDELRLSFRVKSPTGNQTISLSGVGYFDYDIEVIGNIHDNPETLKE